MHTSVQHPPVTGASDQPPAAAEGRLFEDVWRELEQRHAWSIRIDENLNPRPALSKMPFCWQDYDNRHAVAFREQNRLQELVAGAPSDWDALLRLRHWTFINMVNGTNPAIPGLHPSRLLAAARAGGTFYCTHFSVMFVAAASSLGFCARKLGIDGEHNPDEASNMHGVADVWVDSLRKWVTVDPNYDHHYELDGVPQSAEEIGKRWQTHRGEGLRILLGPERRPVTRARRGMPGQPEACSYFWHLIETRNDTFRLDGHGGKTPAVLLVDEARTKQRWHQGKPPKTFEHKRYANGTFLVTTETADAYPDLNAAYFEPKPPHKMPYYGRAEFYTPCAPNFSHYEVSVDGAPPDRIEGREYPWRLHPGRCSLEARAVNLAGHRGPPYRLCVEVTEDTGRKPQWPWPAEEVNFSTRP